MGGVNQDISRVEGCVLKEEISWLTPPTSCFLAQIHRVRQIIIFLNVLNLGWPSEQVPAKQTLFPPLAHIPLPWNYLG